MRKMRKVRQKRDSFLTQEDKQYQKVNSALRPELKSRTGSRVLPFPKLLGDYLKLRRRGVLTYALDDIKPRRATKAAAKKMLSNCLLHTTDDAANILERLYLRYGINPGHTLDILLVHKAAESLFGDTLELAAVRRSKRRRAKQALTVKQAADIITQWLSDPGIHLVPLDKARALAPEMDTEKIASIVVATLNEVSSYLLSIPTMRHRPAELKLRRCARELSQFFTKEARRPLYEYVGELVLAAFPGEWNPTGDLRQATVKLVKAKTDYVPRMGLPLPLPVPKSVKEAWESKANAFLKNLREKLGEKGYPTGGH